MKVAGARRPGPVFGEMMKKNSLPANRCLEMNIFPTRDEMGKAAARDVSLAIGRFFREKGKANVVFAAAPSQDEFLFHLSKDKKIDWSRVTCFHLDEYVDLPRNHPNTFEMYLREHLFDLVSPARIYFLKALQGNPAEVSRKYAEQIRRSGGIDISCIGIGENGHIAFCEPGSDLNDPQMIRVIRINDGSARQQFRDYKDHPNPEARYSSFQAVPRRAFTMTIPAILSAREIFTMVPGAQKAEAVRKMWEGPVSPACPSSALRRHSRVKIYLDRDSAGKLALRDPS
jgi:glucosamine-6-phosphate deaminase